MVEADLSTAIFLVYILHLYRVQFLPPPCPVLAYHYRGGNSIFDIYIKENEIEKEQLIKIQSSNKTYHNFSRLSKKGPFFTVELQINSGDVLTIICENLDCTIY